MYGSTMSLSPAPNDFSVWFHESFRDRICWIKAKCGSGITSRICWYIGSSWKSSYRLSSPTSLTFVPFGDRSIRSIWYVLLFIDTTSFGSRPPSFGS